MYDVYERVKPGLGETVLPTLKGSKQVAAGRAKDKKKLTRPGTAANFMNDLAVRMSECPVR